MINSSWRGLQAVWLLFLSPYFFHWHFHILFWPFQSSLKGLPIILLSVSNFLSFLIFLLSICSDPFTIRLLSLNFVQVSFLFFHLFSFPLVFLHKTILPWIGKVFYWASAYSLKASALIASMKPSYPQSYSFTHVLRI